MKTPQLLQFDYAIQQLSESGLFHLETKMHENPDSDRGSLDENLDGHGISNEHDGAGSEKHRLAMIERPGRSDGRYRLKIPEKLAKLVEMEIKKARDTIAPDERRAACRKPSMSKPRTQRMTNDTRSHEERKTTSMVHAIDDWLAKESKLITGREKLKQRFIREMASVTATRAGEAEKLFEMLVELGRSKRNRRERAEFMGWVSSSSAMPQHDAGVADHYFPLHRLRASFARSQARSHCMPCLSTLFSTPPNAALVPGDDGTD